MSEELSREVKVLEVRVEAVLKKDEVFFRDVRRCIDSFKRFCDGLDRLKIGADETSFDQMSSFRREAILALAAVLEKESDVEHERSHLLESFGGLLQAVEEEFKGLKSPHDTVRP